MDNPHILTYRPGDGTQVVLHIPGDEDPGELCNFVRDRLFDLSAAEKAKQARHAEESFERTWPE